MKKHKKALLIILTLIVVEISVIIIGLKSFNNNEVEKEKVKISKGSFALMLEQTDSSGNGNGQYLESTSNMWPTGKYMYDSKMSHCEDLSSTELEEVLKYSNREKTAYVKAETMTFCWLYFKIDNNPPVVSTFYLGSSPDNPYVNGTGVIGHITYTDDVYVGEKDEGGDANRYCISKTNSTSGCNWVELTEEEIKNRKIDFSYNLDNTESAQTRYVFIEDIAGNISSGVPYTITFDKTVPDVKVSVGNGTTYSKSKTATITISDSNSGLAAGTYTIKYAWGTSAISCNSSELQSTTIVVTEGQKSAQGTVTISGKTGAGKIYVCNASAISDKSGNILNARTSGSANSEANMYLDNTVPYVSVSVDNGTTYSKSKTATITISDGNAGLAVGTYTIKYAWGTSAISCNSSALQSTTIKVTTAGQGSAQGSVTISEKTGTGQIYICNSVDIKDTAGNTLGAKTSGSANDSKYMYLDNTAPSISVALSVGGKTYSGAWVNEKVTAKVSFADGNSGINPGSLQWSYDGTNWKNYSTPNTNSSSYTEQWGESDARKGYYRICDNVGNCSNSNAFSINVDTSAPTDVTSKIRYGSSSGSVRGSVNAFTNQTLWWGDFSAKDSRSGVDHYEYNHGTNCNNNSTNSTLSTSGYTYSSDTNVDFCMRAVDKAGNKSGWSKYYYIKVDKTAPTDVKSEIRYGSSSGAVRGSINAFTNQTLWWGNFSAKDSLSGVDHYEYNHGTNCNNNSTNSTLSTSGYTYSSNTNVDFCMRAVDKAGNPSGWSKYYYIKIDKTYPTITFGISGTTTATISCSETNSSDGKSYWTETLTGTSNKTVSKTCTDAAGNKTTSSHTYTYDSCISGKNTCAYGCDTEWDDCATGSNTCEDSIVSASSESKFICNTGSSFSSVCLNGTAVSVAAESVCRSGTFFTGVITKSGKSRYATCYYCGIGYTFRASYNNCIKYCATGSNTCQGGYVNVPGTCSDCYYGSNTCTGGFKY